MTAQRALRWLGAVLLAATTLLLFAGPAQAATRTVTLTAQGPSPAALTLARGDVVRFNNTDNVSHVIRRTSGAWTFTETIPAGGSATTGAFTASGTYGYSDSYTLVAIPQQANGSFTVPAATPSPTVSPTASPTPGPTRSATPRPSASASASPAASSTPSPGPSSGTAGIPGLGTGQVPTAGPSQTPGPRPDLASPEPSSSSTPTVLYGGKDALVQGSPHRYGLPAALAVVAVTGVVSLLVRLLLADPSLEGRRDRRTRPVVTPVGNAES